MFAKYYQSELQFLREVGRAFGEAHPESALARFNLACYLSLAGEKERTFQQLEAALDLDPHYRELMTQEPDLDNVRSDPGFQALLQISV